MEEGGDASRGGGGEEVWGEVEGVDDGGVGGEGVGGEGVGVTAGGGGDVVLLGGVVGVAGAGAVMGDGVPDISTYTQCIYID